MTGAAINVSRNDEWGTPISLFVGACKEFNVFPELDVSATPQNTKCEKFFTKSQNGLNEDWNIDFWMNPPYSEAGKWIQKAFEEHRKFNVNGIALLFAKTDTKAWHEYILGQENCEVIFIQGRVHFLLPDNTMSKNPATAPSALVVWRQFE